jgi:predicted regulator of Ras-like GTPase activity (Roadblock/LC7/MglB family)
MTPLHKNRAVKKACADALSELKELSASVRIAVIVSDDGFEVSSLGGQSAGDRIASLASSMQALGDTVARETRLSSCERIIIEADNGHILQRRVEGHPLVLCALFGKQEALGRAIFAANTCTGNIADALKLVTT